MYPGYTGGSPAPSAPPDDLLPSIYPSVPPDAYGGVRGSMPAQFQHQTSQYQPQNQQFQLQNQQFQQYPGSPSVPVSVLPGVAGSPVQPGVMQGAAVNFGQASPSRSSFQAPQQPYNSSPTGQFRPQASSASMLHGGFGPVQAMSAASSSSFVDPNNIPGSPASVVELRFRCKGLKKADLLSQSDPFIVLYLQDQNMRGWREIGRTETVRNTPDPSFTTAFQVDFFFEELQRLRVEVFDRDSSSNNLRDHDFLGCVEVTLGQLMAAQGQSKVLALLRDDRSQHHRPHSVSGHVIISAEEVSSCADRLRIRFAASKLDNKDGWFGASDPFVNIYRLRDPASDPSSPSASWLHVWKSEVVMDNLNPRWRPTTLSVQALCNGDLSRVLKLECMDWEKNGRHQLIGSALVKAGEIVAGESRRFELINRERQIKKGKKYKNSGVLLIEEIECFREHTFAEFLRGGCEVSLVVGIDYTASNGAPSDPSSLHYIGASHMGMQNDYQAAITASGAILEPYDSDKRFPVYGFGGMVNGVVNHCFPLTFDPYQPEVEGVAGILRAYADSFQSVRLHGPTHFAPLVRQAGAIAAQFSSGAGSLKYFVLLIITDGAIMDMQQTIDELVQASYQPLSIVIVGVGNADFGAMNALDADGKLLVDSRRQPAARDIVQFVPFNQFRGNPSRLAKETLAEIPTQLLQYFRMKNIEPRAPLQRMATEQLISNRSSFSAAPQPQALGVSPSGFHFNPNEV